MDRRKITEESPILYTVFYGEVAAIQPYGAFVKIPGFKKQGLVHKSQMSKARVEDPSEMLAVGEMVYCKVISLEDNKIGLSMKAVNQTTGKDEDSSNVQLSLDERKKRKGFQNERAKIELGAVLDTTCKKCGGHGHLAQDCFHTKGGKSYELIPEDLTSPGEKDDRTKSKKKKKKEKKEKKAKKSKKRHYSQSSDSERKIKRSKHDSGSSSEGKKYKHQYKDDRKTHQHSSSSSD